MRLEGTEKRNVLVEVSPRQAAWALYELWIKKVAFEEFSLAVGYLEIHQGMWSWITNAGTTAEERKYGRDVPSKEEEIYHAFQCIIKVSNELQ